MSSDSLNAPTPEAAAEGADRPASTIVIRPVPHELIERYRREALAMRRAAILDLTRRLGALLLRPFRAAPVGREPDLVATMSDRVRTPLTAIRSSAEVLHDNPGMSREQRERFTAVVVAECDRLGRAVTELLDQLDRRTRGNRSSLGA
ncbi:MAG: hypothetical protein JNK67_21555 [Alphaproteobacteria bacterium]|nr:hypothetical protein [Alphaproteobacteria bacterium]